MTTQTMNANTQIELSAGMRVLVRGQEWLVTKVETNSLGNRAVTCTGISPLVRDFQATFLDDLDTIEPVDPARTKFIPDTSAHAARSHLFVESLLRSKVPTDNNIHIGNKAAMDSLPYQLVPAVQALAQPRQRILIADAVGLGKTLEAGILMSELIARHKGRRILVVTAKSMMAQFQKEMWERFTIPLISLDSTRIQQIRSEIPANANPFSYYDKVIVSIDTLKRDIQYGAALDASYWDIIVIDEAQNVADRGTGSRKAQRAKLAQRLASRSDTLIMLSATPHDGKARSFASLMNMLDPTTLPDPDRYSPEDIRQLYVRRFKKDVIGDISGRFPEREVTQVRCTASPLEEQAFDVLSQLNLRMDAARRNTNSGLFCTLLEKSLFSSPAACMKTIEERLRKLKKADPEDTTGDAAKLQELHQALASIKPMQFSRYANLLAMLLGAQYGWTGKDTSDRIVIFTERIETKNYLVRQLAHDLKLPKGAIASMDGQMSDVEQQRMVEQFGDPTSPIRVLIASDVASEGLNLHYLSHRLIHFDTPWSLMVFQQRNGRIDRYGQQHTPDIRFMTIESTNEKIKGDSRILEILRQKEQQAYDNIGDPAALMGQYNIEDEEAIVRHAIESGMSMEAFSEQYLTASNADIDELRISESTSMQESQSPEDDLTDDFFDDLFEDDEAETEQPSNVSSTSDINSRISNDRTLMDDYSYAWEGLNWPGFRESAKIDSLQPLSGADGFSMTLHPDSPLRSWLRRRVPNTEILGDNMGQWCTSAEYCEAQANSITAQLRGENWSHTQYLWALNPLMEWIQLKSTSVLYGRGEAPIIGVTNGLLQPDDTIILLSGSIANRHVSPVIEEWFGVRYHNRECAGVIPLEEVWKITGYRGKLLPGSSRYQYVNTEHSTASLQQVERAESLLEDAIAQGTERLEGLRTAYEQRTDPHITQQLQRINEWKLKRMAMLSGKPELENQQRHVNEIYEDYIRWVDESLSASGQPILRVAAAFVGAPDESSRPF